MPFWSPEYISSGVKDCEGIGFFCVYTRGMICSSSSFILGLPLTMAVIGMFLGSTLIGPPRMNIALYLSPG